METIDLTPTPEGVRPLGHDGPHACESECDVGHLRDDEQAEDMRS